MSAPSNRFEAIAQARAIATPDEEIRDLDDALDRLGLIFTMLEPWASEDELTRLDRAIRERSPGMSCGLIWHDRHQEWFTSAEWGREAPDSPMVGAAAYGTGETPEEALDQMLKEMRA